jgi:mono/diheme cytochrome c family protein
MAKVLQRSFNDVNSLNSLSLENRHSETTIFDNASKYGMNELSVTFLNRIEKRGLSAPSFPIHFAAMILPIILALTISVQAERESAPFDYHSISGRPGSSQPKNVMEGESEFELKGKSRVQGMKNFGPHWSGDAHLLWNGIVGEKMGTSFTVAKDGEYALSLVLTLAPDYGIFTIRMNGKIVRKNFDLYAPRVELAKPLNLGKLQLGQGSQTMSFELTGGNPKARMFQGKGYLMGLDYLELERTEEIKPKKDEPKQEFVLKQVPSFEEVRPLFAKYCFECHGNKKKVKGKTNLKVLTSQDHYLKSPELTSKAYEAVAQHEMPPEDEKQPGKEDRERIASFLNSVVNQYATENTVLPPVVLRRMNRYEYNNAVRDLLELRGDVFPLPERVIRGDRHFNPASGSMPSLISVGNRTLGKNQVEQHILTDVDPFAIDLQAEHGFNNQGEQLSTSTILLESLLKLGRSIVNSPEFDRFSGLTNTFFKQDEQPIEDRLKPFLEKAFRQPVSPPTLARYSAYFRSEFKRTGSYAQAMKNVVSAVLASPKFIYLSEEKREVGEKARLSDHELAQRLALFLWSSIPDDELMESAKTGRLNEPEEFDRQVLRMLADRKSRALSENFARQWLRLDQLITAVPDFDRFNEYYSRIGCEQWKFGLQTMIEPLLLFESIQIEDRSIMLLVDSNYAYRSDELQAWYANPAKPFGNKGNANRFNTKVQQYKKRMLSTRREGGIITTAAVLTMTSTPLRTSPIKRGAWVATVIFNDPPPPPPDVVPEIEEDDQALAAQGLSIRERLKQHATDQTCASCHAKIDPLGFALESFDPVGRWREAYGQGIPIDASGKLFGEVEFTNVIEFKDAILQRPETFVRGFGEHMLSYALGRELKVSDKAAVDKITRKALRDKGRFSSIVLEIARSLPFRYKTNQERNHESGKH